MRKRSEPFQPAPASWGKDDLSHLFEAARSNMFAGYAEFPKTYQRMVALDEIFTELFDELRNPEHDLGATFAMRCQSALLAAAQLSLSGQIPESFMVQRGALEFALYAHFIGDSPELQDIWLDRHESADARKLCGRTFSPKVMLSRLTAKSQVIGDRARILYETSIDYGAHPNTKAVFNALTISPLDDGAKLFETDFLTARTEFVTFGLLTWCSVAVNCLEIFEFVFPKRYELLGLSKRIDSLRQETVEDAILFAKSP